MGVISCAGAYGHAPHGACELKLKAVKSVKYLDEGHAPHGACELKFCAEMSIVSDSSHAPHGACELKF